MMSVTMVSLTIVPNAFSSNLETHKSQNFPMVAHGGVAKLSTSPEVTIFPHRYPIPSFQITV